MIQTPAVVTPAMVEEYRHHNRWGHDPRICRQMGPRSGFCTLVFGHDGLHVAHNTMATLYHDDSIHSAWYDHTEDMLMDVGL